MKTMKKYLLPFLALSLFTITTLSAQTPSPAQTITTLNGMAAVYINAATVISNQNTQIATVTQQNQTLTTQLAAANKTISDGQAQMAAVYAAATKLNMALPAASQVTGQ